MNSLIIGAGDQLPLLRSLIEQQFPAVTVIDPVGDLAEATADCIPRQYLKDTNYFDPSDAENIASFNVFSRVKDKAKLVQDLCAFFQAQFPAGAQTLTTLNSTFVLANILTIISDRPDVTFIHVLEFLSDMSFRNKCLKHCTNPMALRNWSSIEAWDQAQRKAAFAQIETKLGTLLLSPVMYRTLLTKPRMSFTKSGIFIANLSRKKIGDQASRMLGTLLISRAKTPVFINDFGFFSSEYLASLFSYGGYTISLRTLSDVKDIKDTVLNFEEKTAFRLTPDDAKELQPYISGVSNPNVFLDLSPKDFLPSRSIHPPRTSGSFAVVRKHSIACHTRPFQEPTKPTRIKRKGRAW